MLTEAFQQVMNYAASGKLRIETERVPLAEIEDAWERNVPARRLVVIP
jgi:NADPH2:quinone reductase